MDANIEIKLNIERAQTALQESRDNLTLGHYDVATSRAYYAMFYATRALLLTKNISPRKHSGVHSAFAQHFVKPGLIEPEYSRMLGNAFRLRLDSDYEMLPSSGNVSASQVLENAKQFVQRATAYLKQEGYLPNES